MENKLDINQKNVQEIEGKMKLTKFDQNVRELEQILNNHAKKEQREKNFRERLEESERQEKQSKERKIEKKHHQTVAIATALIVSASVAIGAAAHKGYENMQGKNEILNEFYQSVGDFSVTDRSNGYIINVGEENIDFETGIHMMVDSARRYGLSDQEIAIGLEDGFNRNTAKYGVGEENYPDRQEKVALYQQAYHKKSLAKENKETMKEEKGKGK